MSILLASLLVGGGIFVGRLVSRRARERDAEGRKGGGGPLENTVADRVPSAPPVAVRKPPAQDALTEFPCQLGDVVIVRGGEEAWLAGALVFFEQAAAAALFVAPEAGADRALYVRPNPSPSLVWLMPLGADELIVGSEPPSSLEHKTERFERVRRLPFRVERAGTGAPDVGEQAIVAEYVSGDERLLVVVGSTASRAWRGSVLPEAAYDVLPAGKSTL